MPKPQEIKIVEPADLADRELLCGTLIYTATATDASNSAINLDSYFTVDKPNSKLTVKLDYLNQPANAGSFEREIDVSIKKHHAAFPGTFDTFTFKVLELNCDLVEKGHASPVDFEVMMMNFADTITFGENEISLPASLPSACHTHATHYYRLYGPYPNPPYTEIYYNTQIFHEPSWINPQAGPNLN